MEAGALVLFIIITFMYFIPTVVAAKRGKANTTAIFVLNLLLGWTFIGWVVALIWAASTQQVDRPVDAEAQLPRASHSGSGRAVVAFAVVLVVVIGAAIIGVLSGPTPTPQRSQRQPAPLQSARPSRPRVNYTVTGEQGIMHLVWIRSGSTDEDLWSAADDLIGSKPVGEVIFWNDRNYAAHSLPMSVNSVCHELAIILINRSRGIRELTHSPRADGCS